MMWGCRGSAAQVSTQSYGRVRLVWLSSVCPQAHTYVSVATSLRLLTSALQCVLAWEHAPATDAAAQYNATPAKECCIRNDFWRLCHKMSHCFGEFFIKMNGSTVKI